MRGKSLLDKLVMIPCTWAAAATAYCSDTISAPSLPSLLAKLWFADSTSTLHTERPGARALSVSRDRLEDIEVESFPLPQVFCFSCNFCHSRVPIVRDICGGILDLTNDSRLRGPLVDSRGREEKKDNNLWFQIGAPDLTTTVQIEHLYPGGRDDEKQNQTAPLLAGANIRACAFGLETAALRFPLIGNPHVQDRPPTPSPDVLHVLAWRL